MDTPEEIASAALWLCSDVGGFTIGHTITGDSALRQVMHQISQDALRITGELNSGVQEPARVRGLLAQLTGKPVDESVTVFPPLYSDFGKNITLRKRVFINSGCKFQDQGGVVIGTTAWSGTTR